MTNALNEMKLRALKLAFVDAIADLNEEGFNYVSWMVYQQSTTAGGFTDHEGWLKLRQAGEALPYIADANAKLAAAYEALDNAQTEVVEIKSTSTS